MSAEVTITLAPTRQVSIVLYADVDTTLDVGPSPVDLDVLLSPIYRGTKGDKGDPGQDGALGSDSRFVFNQAIPTTSVDIAHGLNKFPSVTAVDTSNREIEGDVIYLDANNVRLLFNFPTSFKVYFN